MENISDYNYEETIDSVNAGDKFMCIKEVVMSASKKIDYIEGKIYTSEFDNNITDNSNCKFHGWNTSVVNKFFKKIIPFVLPEKLYCIVTKENHIILDKWRLSVATTYNKQSISIGTPVLSKHPFDGSHFYSFSIKDMLAESDFEDYEEITTEQFIKYVLNDNGPNKTIQKERKLTPAQAQSIVDIACKTWKEKLVALWARDIVLGLDIIITEEFYKEMRNACTRPQHELFDKIFGKDFEAYPKGTPCLVRSTPTCSWFLAYADGNGMFYHFSQKNGSVRDYPYHMKLDANNLPND